MTHLLCRQQSWMQTAWLFDPLQLNRKRCQMTSSALWKRLWLCLDSLQERQAATMISLRIWMLQSAKLITTAAALWTLDHWSVKRAECQIAEFYWISEIARPLSIMVPSHFWASESPCFVCWAVLFESPWICWQLEVPCNPSDILQWFINLLFRVTSSSKQSGQRKCHCFRALGGEKPMKSSTADEVIYCMFANWNSK